MIDFERILHPTDCSPHADLALRYACGLTEQFGAELHLLHVVPDAAVIDAGGALGGYLPPQDWLDSLVKASKEQLAKIPERGWAANKHIVRATVQGIVFLEIIRYAEEHAIDLIVVGTHGRSGLAHMLMGSVAEKIVRQAPCPVMTIRPEEHRSAVSR